jgi:arylsulfatase A-like enzyme
VPFIWHDPRANDDNVASSNLASSIDISATILARAGIQPFNGLQGRDLLTTPPAKAIIVEEDSQRPMNGFDRPQRVRTVVTDRYRMSLRQGEDWHELYDLKEDPHEMRNLYGSASAEQIQAETTDIMLRRMIELQGRAPLPAYRA